MNNFNEDRIPKVVLDAYKPLTPSEERICLEQAKNGNKKAARKLINSITPMIAAIANRMGKGILTPNDLFSEGIIGAYKAIDKFDLTFNNRWSTYALMEELKNKSGWVTQRAGWIVQTMQQAIYQAHLVPVSVKDRRQGQFNEIVSYDAPISNNADSLTLADVLAAESNETTVTELDSSNVIVQIKDADLRKLMTLFASGMTCREVGQTMGLNRQTALNRRNAGIKTLQRLVKV